jgi:23S rRNA (guanosine2251-2'-O)-methyltransferase
MVENLYGRNPVYECLRAGRRDVFRLFLAQGVREQGAVRHIVDLSAERQVPLQRVARRQLDGLASGASHQGVVAEVAGYPYATLDEVFALAERRVEPPWLLLLDCLQDPQNLGTLLRTAEAVGVHGVVIPDRRSAAVTPAVVNASSGACEHLYVVQITNMARTMRTLKERDVWIAGLEDVAGATLLWQANLEGALALVVGSEGQGMRRLVRETCDFLVRLPMRGQVASLNAAVAGSVALYEVARRRGIGSAP